MGSFKKHVNEFLDTRVLHFFEARRLVRRWKRLTEKLTLLGRPFKRGPEGIAEDEAFLDSLVAEIEQKTVVGYQESPGFGQGWGSPYTSDESLEEDIELQRRPDEGPHQEAAPDTECDEAEGEC